MPETKSSKNIHIPVLLSAVLKHLSPQKDESYLDLTAGYGGHAKEILNVSVNYSSSVLVDRDQDAVDYLAKLFNGTGVRLIKNDFAQACAMLIDKGKQFDIVLADLGVSSPHLDKASRGFSFSADGPLDMRMDQQQQLTAETIVNDYSEAELAELLYLNSGEPKARAIARVIVQNRPFKTTAQLALVIAHSAVYRGYSKRHPATKTFQALRIAVNDELNQLTRSLPLMFKLLKPRGRLGIISFHSLEDRMVKDFFNQLGGDRYDAEAEIITKSPVTADENELVTNPRSRSAKLRVVLKK